MRVNMPMLPRIAFNDVGQISDIENQIDSLNEKIDVLNKKMDKILMAFNIEYGVEDEV